MRRPPDPRTTVAAGGGDTLAIGEEGHTDHIAAVAFDSPVPYRGGEACIESIFSWASGKRTRTCRRSGSTTRATVAHDLPASFAGLPSANEAWKPPESWSSILRSAGSVFRWVAIALLSASPLLPSLTLLMSVRSRS